jgi:hypothetical protein
MNMVTQHRMRQTSNGSGWGGRLLAVAILGLAGSAHAGKITAVPSQTGAPGFGGWNLGNVQVVLNGVGSGFDPLTGAYTFAAGSDFTYQANVFDTTNLVTMGIVLAKDWPVGEPAGIKVVNDDPGAKQGKPANCIMATSYLKDHYLDSADPKQVICSSPFQTHKRFKVAMRPSTVDGQGSESVDLVFNVEPEVGERTYEMFQKINNWTGKRLAGFKVEVGFGVGTGFRSASAAGVPLAQLNIAVPSDLWSPTQLATFSAGLFGPLDKHTGEVGFFDTNKRAGFYIDQYVTGVQPLTDTLTAKTPLPSNYGDVPAGAGAAAGQFGPWLPNNMLPTGIFFDDDGNPDTDAALVAWYGYNPATSRLGWMRGALGSFAEISAVEIQAMGTNLLYTSDVIDDLVNVGLNYVVRIGDVSTFPGTGNKTFTIRVTPTADNSGVAAPLFVGAQPNPLLLYPRSDAAVQLDPRPTFATGSLLTARVGDNDLNIDKLKADTATVNIATSAGLKGSLQLIEQGVNRGVFAATLPEAFSNVPAGTIVTMSYFDASAGVTRTSSTTAAGAPVPILSDVSITDLSVPTSIIDGLARTLMLTIANDKLAAAPATGEVLLTGTDGSEFRAAFTDLRAGAKLKFSFRWTARLADPTKPAAVEWRASVIVNGQQVDGVDAGYTTQVLVKQGKNAK